MTKAPEKKFQNQVGTTDTWMTSIEIAISIANKPLTNV